MSELKFERLEQLLEQHSYRELRAALLDVNEIDIAELLGQLSPEQSLIVFRMLGKDRCAEVFAELDSELQQHIINAFSDKELGFIVEELFVDDAVDMLEDMPASVVHRVLKVATPETRSLINKFLKYPADSAGSIMTAEFVDLKKDMSVAQAKEHIRATGIKKELLYVCYVVDSARVLLGVVTLKDLLFAQRDDIIGEIMQPNVISVKTLDDEELVVSQISKYNFLAIPVTDAENRLVGIVTYDDALDVMEEETSEDFHKMAAMLPSEKEYLKTSVFAMFKNRIVWLLILMVSGMITGSILDRYEQAIAVLPLLVTFMPMLTDTGGNAGSQSATMVIRGIATGEIELGDWARVLWKELRVALMCGAVLCAVNLCRIMLFYGSRSGILMQSLVVSVSLLAAVVLAKTIGGLLPLLAEKLHIDPAIMAAPLITTIVDAVSLSIYFSLATALLL